MKIVLFLQQFYNQYNWVPDSTRQDPEEYCSSIFQLKNFLIHCFYAHLGWISLFDEHFKNAYLGCKEYWTLFPGLLRFWSKFQIRCTKCSRKRKINSKNRLQIDVKIVEWKLLQPFFTFCYSTFGVEEITAWNHTAEINSAFRS